MSWWNVAGFALAVVFTVECTKAAVAAPNVAAMLLFCVLAALALVMGLGILAEQENNERGN